MKKHLILLGVLLSSQLSIAGGLAPTKAQIISQDSEVAWVKFIDNSDGDVFRFYLDGQTNSTVIGDRKDTTWRNGKSRVVPFKLNKLPPKTYKVTIGVIKDNQKVAQSTAFDLTIGDKDQSPTIEKVFKGSERYTWVKFIDNSNADLFRFYFNGEENKEAIKDYTDRTERNGKARVVPINVTKLAPNTKFDVTIGVIKDDKKIAESEVFTIETGDAVDLRAKVIEFNREYGTYGVTFIQDIQVDFYFDDHLAQITGNEFGGPEYVNFYRIDDNNNIKTIPILPYREIHTSSHESIRLEPYNNDTKLRIGGIISGGEERRCQYYNTHDLDNIQIIGEIVIDNYGGNSCSNHDM